MGKELSDKEADVIRGLADTPTGRYIKGVIESKRNHIYSSTQCPGDLCHVYHGCLECPRHYVRHLNK